MCSNICVLVFLLKIRRPPRSTRTDTPFPDTTLFRSVGSGADTPAAEQDLHRLAADDAGAELHGGGRGGAPFFHQVQSARIDQVFPVKPLGSQPEEKEIGREHV